MTQKPPPRLIPAFEGDDPDWVQTPLWAPEPPAPPPAETPERSQ